LLGENLAGLAGCTSVEEHDPALKRANMSGIHFERGDTDPVGAELKTVEPAKGCGILILLPDRCLKPAGLDLIGRLGELLFAHHLTLQGAEDIAKCYRCCAG